MRDILGRCVKKKISPQGNVPTGTPLPRPTSLRGMAGQLSTAVERVPGRRIWPSPGTPCCLLCGHAGVGRGTRAACCAADRVLPCLSIDIGCRLLISICSGESVEDKWMAAGEKATVQADKNGKMLSSPCHCSPHQGFRSEVVAKIYLTNWIVFVFHPAYIAASGERSPKESLDKLDFFFVFLSFTLLTSRLPGWGRRKNHSANWFFCLFTFHLAHVAASGERSPKELLDKLECFVFLSFTSSKATPPGSGAQQKKVEQGVLYASTMRRVVWNASIFVSFTQLQQGCPSPERDGGVPSLGKCDEAQPSLSRWCVGCTVHRRRLGVQNFLMYSWPPLQMCGIRSSFFVRLLRNLSQGVLISPQGNTVRSMLTARPHTYTRFSYKACLRFMAMDGFRFRITVWMVCWEPHKIFFKQYVSRILASRHPR